ncbi:hypothetical protein B0H19DRAFT_1235808 [Mycena capillaripes]|nr:hypothetical protein B0H19DRAFT_1235808 [Mycena capillaripes]
MNQATYTFADGSFWIIRIGSSRRSRSSAVPWNNCPPDVVGPTWQMCSSRWSSDGVHFQDQPLPEKLVSTVSELLGHKKIMQAVHEIKAKLAPYAEEYPRTGWEQTAIMNSCYAIKSDSSGTASIVALILSFKLITTAITWFMFKNVATAVVELGSRFNRLDDPFLLPTEGTQLFMRKNLLGGGFSISSQRPIGHPYVPNDLPMSVWTYVDQPERPYEANGSSESKIYHGQSISENLAVVGLKRGEVNRRRINPAKINHMISRNPRLSWDVALGSVIGQSLRTFSKDPTYIWHSEMTGRMLLA